MEQPLGETKIVFLQNELPKQQVVTLYRITPEVKYPNFDKSTPDIGIMSITFTD
jgi:hypothetical protein